MHGCYKGPLGREAKSAAQQAQMPGPLGASLGVLGSLRGRTGRTSCCLLYLVLQRVRPSALLHMVGQGLQGPGRRGMGPPPPHVPQSMCPGLRPRRPVPARVPVPRQRREPASKAPVAQPADGPGGAPGGIALPRSGRLLVGRGLLRVAGLLGGLPARAQGRGHPGAKAGSLEVGLAGAVVPGEAGEAKALLRVVRGRPVGPQLPRGEDPSRCHVLPPPQDVVHGVGAAGMRRSDAGGPKTARSPGVEAASQPPRLPPPHGTVEEEQGG